jgi:DNA recombination protein RmuC
MTQEFTLLANNVMQTHGETFSKQNKEQIDTILAPLREKLTEFQLGIQTAQVETTKERAGLAEQIRLLSENSAKITSTPRRKWRLGLSRRVESYLPQPSEM